MRSLLCPFPLFRRRLDWDTKARDLEGHYAVPPDWSVVKEPKDDLPEVVVVGTGFYEPSCEHNQLVRAQRYSQVEWAGEGRRRHYGGI